MASSHSRCLVRATSAPKDDDVMWSERFSHVRERYVDKVGLELQSTVWSTYQISENTWVNVLVHTTEGSLWICERRIWEHNSNNES